MSKWHLLSEWKFKQCKIMKNSVIIVKFPTEHLFEYEKDDIIICVQS